LHSLDPNGVFESLTVGETATDSFRYTISDGQGGTDTATVTVTISGVNDDPTAVGDNGGSTDKAASFTTANVLVNDSDPDSSDTLSVSGLDTSGTTGLVSNNSDGTFGYDPNSAFDSLAGGTSATDTFKYTVTDGQGGTDTATVTVTITGQQPPVAGDDNAATDEDTPTTISVLANDTDADGGTPSVQAVDTSGTIGTVTNNGSDVDYDPNGAFESLAVGETATDNFKYTVTDGQGDSDTATVTVTISGINDDPTAVGDDTDATDSASSFTTANVLANDSDPDTSDTLSVSGLDTSGTAGLVSNNNDGTFGYDPNGAFDSLAGGASATDTFKYTVTDGQGGTDTATVTVTITGQQPPVAGDDNAATGEDTATIISVLGNDTDGDGDPFAVQAVDTSDTTGTVTNNGSDVDYDPNGQFESLAFGETATDTFRYTISDDHGGTDTATVTVTISGVNDAPTAVGDDNDSTDGASSFTTANVLLNDSDPDSSDTLSVSALDTSGTAGLVTNNSDGTFGYDPNGSFESLAVGETATDTFNYTVTDGQGGTDTATVTVTISGVNDTPTALDDDGGSTHRTSSFTTANVLANDSDPDSSDALSVSGFDTSGTAGLVTNNSDGTFNYDPNGAFDSLAGGASATDTFKYTVTDGQGGTDTATVTVTITNGTPATAPNTVSDLVLWLDADDHRYR